MAEGYCVKCKAKKEMKDAKEVTMKNGRKAMKGVCPSCGTGMYRNGQVIITCLLFFVSQMEFY